MQRLTGLDAGFLHMETRTHKLHGTHLAILRDPSGERTITIEDVAAHMERRLPALPWFRRRVLDVPLGLHHPVWVDDPDFDLARHLRVVHLDAPGGDAEVDAILEEMSLWPLDRRHPLWRLTLVDGLAGGRFLLGLTMHHTMVDGRAVLKVFDTLLGPTDPPPEPWVPEPFPSRRTLVRDALADQRRQLAQLPAFTRRSVEALRALGRRRAEAEVALPGPMDVPFTVLNESFTNERRFRRLTIPMAQLRTIRRGLGCSMNDVFLALITASVADYLRRVDATVEGPLVVNVPVSTEAPDSPDRTAGNHVANLYLPLPVDEPDPWRRVAALRAAADEGQAQLEVVGRSIVEDLLEFAAPCVAVPATAIFQGRERRAAARGAPVRPSYNVVTSNLPGPQAQYQIGPFVVEDLRMTGLITQGIGLMFTLFTYAGQAGVTVTTNPDAIPEPEWIVDAFLRAVDELLELAEAASATPVASPA